MQESDLIEFEEGFNLSPGSRVYLFGMPYDTCAVMYGDGLSEVGWGVWGGDSDAMFGYGSPILPEKTALRPRQEAI